MHGQLPVEFQRSTPRETLEVRNLQELTRQYKCVTAVGEEVAVFKRRRKPPEAAAACRRRVTLQVAASPPPEADPHAHIALK